MAGPQALTSNGRTSHGRMRVRVRPARTDEGPLLQDIERRAGQRFHEVDMGDIADDDPPPLDTLADAHVAVADDDRPLGYVLVDEVDGNAHVEQVTVDSAWQGRGVGRALLDWVDDWARARGLAAVTLTTFADVPWNRPLYEHLGFSVLAEDDLGAGLQRVWEDEAAHGLDPALRVCMRRDVAG